MTVPTTSELWPSLESMKQYLEAWAKYAYEQEARVRTLENMSKRMEATYTEEIDRLTNELANCVEPRERQIAELKSTIRGMEVYTQDLLAERRRAIERLAQVLEASVTPATALADLISQTMTLVHHTKNMFRERL